MKRLLTILLLILLSTHLISKESIGKNKKIHAKKCAKITLDGKLTEDVWNKQPITGFIQRKPEEGQPASEKTHAWIAYDNEYLYIAARLYDKEPSQIDRQFLRRDENVDTDVFFVFLDPFKDNRTGYFFGVNPGGSMIDGTMSNDSWTNRDWDGIWECKTTIDEQGWCCEIKIPFAQLRFNSNENMVWGVNLNREIKRKGEDNYFIMVPQTESGFVSHFASLEGLKGIEPHQKFEVTPYIVQKAKYLIDDDGPFYKSNQYKTTIGADFKIGIGSNLNLDLTVNPDFGQVEVDPAVVNLSASETFYNEKRPFFIEGNSIFNFGFGGSNNNWGFNFSQPSLFYSRRIGRAPQGSSPHDGEVYQPDEARILGAAKLTGKIAGKWNVGVISAVTERTFAQTDSSGIRFENEVEPLTHYGVIRAQREFNDGKQGLGFLSTIVNRDNSNLAMSDLLSKGAYAFGVDGWTFLDNDEEYVITGSVVGSYIHGSNEFMQSLQKRSYRYFQRPDKKNFTYDENINSMTGMYSRFMLNKQKGNFRLNAAIGAASPTFEYNDLGSQWMADRINGHVVAGYQWFEPDSLFRYKSFNIAYTRSINFDKDVIDNRFYYNGYFEFNNYYSFGFNGGYNFERYSNSFTRGGPLYKVPKSYGIGIWGNSDSRKSYKFHFDYFYWKYEDGSYSNDYGLSFNWNPDPSVSLSVGPQYSYNWEEHQWVGSYEDETATHTFGNRYVYAEMEQQTIAANIRLNWSFTPKLTLQLYVQPLISVGDYGQLKEFTTPGSNEFRNYTNVSVHPDSDNDNYMVDPDGTGPAQEIEVDNRNFNYKSLRGNAVLRWEVQPGSILYLVWSHDQVNYQDPGEFRPGNDFKNLWNAQSDNIFMLKYSYWFDF